MTIQSLTCGASKTYVRVPYIELFIVDLRQRLELLPST